MLTTINDVALTKEQLSIIKSDIAVDFEHTNINKFKLLIMQSKRVFNLWDSDIDGLISGYISSENLTKLNKEVKNYSHESKIHGLTSEVVRYIIRNEYDTVLIVDAGSNDIEMINELLNRGIKVIILDHHEHTNDIEHENFCLINCKQVEGYESCSGAFVVYHAFKKAFINTTLNDYEDLIALSVVSDVCKRSKVNIQILKNYIMMLYKESKLMSVFNRNKMNVNSISNLISVSSKLNAIIRLYGSRHTMNLILNNHKELMTLIKNSNQIKEKNQHVVDALIKQSQFYKFKNMVVCFIPEQVEMWDSIIVRNYIGIVANKMSQATGLVSLVLLDEKYNKEQCITKEYKYCYSARDFMGLSSLDEFQLFGLDANGHRNAWGGTFTNSDIKMFGRVDEYIGLNIKNKYETKTTGQVYGLTSIKQLSTLTEDKLVLISMYNVLTDNESRIGFKFELEGIITTKRTIKEIKYGNMEFISFESKIFVGDEVICYPELNGRITYLLETVK